MQVKDLILSKVSLAPMAGITDYVLRSLVREHSSSCLLTTEMISSEALTQVKDTDIIKNDKNIKSKELYIQHIKLYQVQEKMD